MRSVAVAGANSDTETLRRALAALVDLEPILGLVSRANQ
jgi:hypothetical protein